MSLSKAFKPVRRSVLLGAVLALPVILAGCQVKPLYGSSASNSSIGALKISLADDRVEQVVRNQLVFLNGGANNDKVAEHSLELNVSSKKAGILDSGTDNNFTAGRMTVTGTFTLTRISDSVVIHKGKRVAIALYDLPDQEFARIRAIKDAEDKAARELAEFIYTDVSIALAP